MFLLSWSWDDKRRWQRDMWVDKSVSICGTRNPNWAVQLFFHPYCLTAKKNPTKDNFCTIPWAAPEITFGKQKNTFSIFSENILQKQLNHFPSHSPKTHQTLTIRLQKDHVLTLRIHLTDSSIELVAGLLKISWKSGLSWKTKLMKFDNKALYSPCHPPSTETTRFFLQDKTDQLSRKPTRKLCTWDLLRPSPHTPETSATNWFCVKVTTMFPHKIVSSSRSQADPI